MEHNSINITSPHKILIIHVTIAGLIAEKAGFGTFNQVKEDMLRQLLPHLCITEDDVLNYTQNYIDILGKDRLFIECQSLFGLDIKDATP